MMVWLCSIQIVLLAQTRTLTGTVTDASDGMPIPGVNVYDKATNAGVTTDLDGNYSISVTNSSVLVFSFIGYNSQEYEVGNRSSLDVVLQGDVSDLAEVVVTALGIEKERRSLAYSISEVKGDDLIEAREINLGDQLQGRIAGVNVSNIGSGVAGSSRVVIRGNTSLTGNNQPLYVIDGVPMDNSQLGSAGMWGGVDWGDGLSSLNPDDIESLSVLKGNTAAALYGSRASNGVVLITTKKGTKRQGIGVEVNSQYTAERIFNLFDFQQEYGHGSAGMKPTNPGQGREFGGISWGARLDGSPVYQFDGVERPYSYAGDNFNRFYRTGSTLTNTVALTGGNDKQTFRFSMSDLRNEAITPNSGMDRQTATLSTNANYVEKLTLSAKLQYTRENVRNRARLSDSPGNSNATLAILPPNINVDDLRGDPDKLGARPDNGRELQYNDNTFSQNPWWAAYQFENSNVRDRIIGSAMARYDFTDWLYAQARIGMDWYTSRRRSLEPYGTAYRQLGALNEEQIRVREINTEYIIGAQKEFGDFNVNAFFGGNMMERSYENLGARAENFNVPFLHSVINGSNQSIIFDFNQEGINSLFGSTEFSYKNLLFLNVTARNDWFSTLPVDSNSILYPSVGGSFVFSDAFMLPSWISFGKVRGSWAEVGGGANPYQLALNYSLVGQGHMGAALGRIDQTSVPNSMLQPLTAGEFEVGFDIRFLDDRFGIDYAYYDRTTRNDIIQTTIPNASGFGQATVNVGEVSNRGHEVLFTANVIESQDFSWSSNLNLSYNINNVESLFEDSRVLSVDEARTGGAFIQHRIPYTDQNGVFMPGGYSVIMGRKHQRINGQKVYDENGLPLFTDDLHYLGSGISPWAGGWNNSFRIKNVSVGMLFDFKFGGSIYSGTNARAYATGNHKETLEGREDGLVVSGVDGNGEERTWNIAARDQSLQGITTVQDYYGRMAEITENFVYDSDFVKLRQVSIGYNIPTRLLDRTPITGMNVSLIARNLLLLYSKVDNIDPESTFNSLNGQGIEYYGVPQTRSYGFNISMKF